MDANSRRTDQYIGTLSAQRDEASRALRAVEDRIAERRRRAVRRAVMAPKPKPKPKSKSKLALSPPRGGHGDGDGAALWGATMGALRAALGASPEPPPAASLASGVSKSPPPPPPPAPLAAAVPAAPQVRAAAKVAVRRPKSSPSRWRQREAELAAAQQQTKDRAAGRFTRAVPALPGADEHKSDDPTVGISFGGAPSSRVATLIQQQVEAAATKQQQHQQQQQPPPQAVQPLRLALVPIHEVDSSRGSSPTSSVTSSQRRPDTPGTGFSTSWRAARVESPVSVSGSAVGDDHERPRAAARPVQAVVDPAPVEVENAAAPPVRVDPVPARDPHAELHAGGASAGASAPAQRPALQLQQSRKWGVMLDHDRIGSSSGTAPAPEPAAPSRRRTSCLRSLCCR